MRRLLVVLAALAGLAVLAAGSVAAASDSWEQVGGDIDGRAAADESGYSVALSADGTRLAVGAPNTAGASSGYVRVFEWSGTAWARLGADIEAEPQASLDATGFSVSLDADGSRVAIGAPFNDGNGSNSGHVRVFELAEAEWVQMGADLDGEAAGDNAGYSVSLSADGRRVAMGAPFNDGNGNFAGHVRVFEWSGVAWVQVADDIDGDAAGDRFGESVALNANGSRLAVGAPGNDRNGTNAGRVRVFIDLYGDAWAWVQAPIDGEAAGDGSGRSVALNANGTRVAIGARFNDDNGEAAGQVRVFDWTGSAWVQMGGDIDGEAANDGLGFSVSLSADGSRLAVGARFNDGNGDAAGHARVYDMELVLGVPVWLQRGADIDGESAGDRAGSSVALSADGSRLAVGAPHNDGNGLDSGHARVFETMGQLDIPSMTTCFMAPVTVDLNLGQTPTTGDDVILGTPNADVIDALAGDDLICAGAGDDMVDAGPGSDRVYGSTGRDFIRGGDGDDTIDGGDGNDRLFGDAGSDELRGADGRDVIRGGTGADTIEGGRHNDRLSGNAGADVLVGGNGRDRLFGNSGDDRLVGGGGNDRLYGGVGIDTVDGRVGADVCQGEDLSNCELIR